MHPSPPVNQTRNASAALFATVSVLWGIPYLLIAVALDNGLTPLATVAGRITVGAAVLLVLAGKSAWRLLRSHPVKVTALATVEVVIPFTLIAVGETRVDSATAGVLIALEPMFVLASNALLGQHLPHWQRAAIGSVVGLVGVVVLLGAPTGGSQGLLIVAAAASYGLGAVLVTKTFPDTPSLPLVAAMLAVAVPLTVGGAALEGPPTIGLEGCAAIIVLGVVCTAGGFVAFFALISNSGAHTASLITYAAPLVAIAAGALIRDEPVGAAALAGTALVLLGARISVGRRTTT